MSQTIEMFKFSVSLQQRLLMVAERRNPEQNEIIAITVPPDRELVFSLRNFPDRIKVEVDCEEGNYRNHRLASEYVLTCLQEVENSNVEFKRSLFAPPQQDGTPDQQMRTIAKTIASFMNCDGGALYFGVDDSGRVRGLAEEYGRLNNDHGSLAVKGMFFQDEEFSYTGNADGYFRKIHAVVRSYLGSDAESYLGDCVESVGSGNRPYIKLSINPAPKDVIVYFPSGDEREIVENIYVRNGASKKALKGKARDQFVRERVKNQLLEDYQKVIAGRDADANKIKAMLERLDQLGADRVVVGAPVVVTGAHPLTEQAITPISSPRGVVFDGEHLCDVRSWKEVFGVIYQKLNDLNPGAFDSLIEDGTMSKHFKRGRRCTGCYAFRFGTNGDVRAVEVSNKANLWNERYFFHRVFNACGVEPSRFMIRA